ncbi:hypothetical protein HDU76_000773, partial [Blyttiomyces sp. JEL0837]
GPRVDVAVILQTPDQTKSMYYYSITSDGHHLQHFSKDVYFQATGWAHSKIVKTSPSSASSQQSESESLDSIDSASSSKEKQHRTKFTALTSESIRLIESLNMSPPTLLHHLQKFTEASEAFAYKKSEELKKMHQYFTTQGLRKIKLDRAARWVFHKGDPSAIPTPAQCYAVFRYMIKGNVKYVVESTSGGNFGGLSGGGVAEELRSRREFGFRRNEEVENIRWLEGQTKGVQVGKYLKGFLEKAGQRVQWAKEVGGFDASVVGGGKGDSDVPPPAITYTNEDRKFINAIREAAVAPATPASPYTAIVHRGILSRLSGYSEMVSGAATYQAKTQACMQLLKDLGAFAPWEDVPMIMEAKGMETLEGHGGPRWADFAAEEADGWANVLLGQHDVAESGTEPASALEVPGFNSAEVIRYGQSRLRPEMDNPVHDLLEAIRSRTVFPQLVSSDDFYKVDPCAEIRRDFGDMPVYVIDSPTAHELDDGISIEHKDNGETWIHVHIADPTSELPPSHPLAFLAQLRGNTVYLPERHYPMIPDSLSLNRFNLGVSNLALTFSARLGM